MEKRLILADTSALIEYFRKTDKSNARLLAYLEDGYFFSISAITSYEIFTGVKEGQKDFWNAFLEKVDVLSVDKEVVEIAVDVNNRLKKMRKQIDIADLFIAATAIMYDLPILTLNSNHFERIENLVVL